LGRADKRVRQSKTIASGDEPGLKDRPSAPASVRSPAPVYDYNFPMHDVVVYSRKGCHLCEVVKETLTQIESDAGFEWREVDIDADPDLQRKYNDQVPVVFIDGRKAFKYRMDAGEFLRALARRASNAEPGHEGRVLS